MTACLHTVNFTCIVSSPETPIKVFRNGTLRILQLTEKDGGNYLCVFQRPNGEDMELFQVRLEQTLTFYKYLEIKMIVCPAFSRWY